MQQSWSPRLISALASLLWIVPPAVAEPQEATEDLPRFSCVNPGVFRGGQPTAEGFMKLKENGIHTIVSLRNNKALCASEKQRAEALGMQFVNIPLDGISKPSRKAVLQFLEIVESEKAKPVFVHCQYGQDRTGTMIAIYREESQKWSAEQAYQEMLANGFHKKYAWLSDAVYDYEEKKGLPPSRKETAGSAHP